MPPAPTDGYYLLCGRHVDLLNGYADSESERLERELQRVLQHRQEGSALFGIAVSVNDGLSNEAIQPSSTG